MDEDINTNTTDEGALGRSEEEIEWDAEFADMKEPSTGGVAGTVNDFASVLLKLPAALMKLPMTLLPEDTAKHTRAALREGFLAWRSVVDKVNDNIENMLAEDGNKKPTVKGPEGTWGTGRHGSDTPTPSKNRRIELQDEPSSGSSFDALVDAADGNSEGRGLNADIDY